MICSWLMVASLRLLFAINSLRRRQIIDLITEHSVVGCFQVFFSRSVPQCCVAVCNQTLILSVALFTPHHQNHLAFTISNGFLRDSSQCFAQDLTPAVRRPYTVLGASSSSSPKFKRIEQETKWMVSIQERTPEIEELTLVIMHSGVS